MVQKQELKGMIGLEIHAYLVTKEKLFCDCEASREKGLQGNSNICPICTGQPGAKPMLANEEAVKKAVMIGLMLGCKMNKEMKWQRKHYDWPDMPKGFQTTLSGAGAIPVGEGGKFFGIRIRSMHLEEDPASWEPTTGMVDYNRSGLPLVEIVTEPDFETSEQVMEWLKKLIHNLAYLKAVDSNAGIKVDTTVSIPNKTERVEVKNISSIDAIGKAIEYEIERQSREGSERETRRWDEAKGKTIRMRGKEDVEDYRFIVEPDLLEIVLEDRFINEMASKVPESPTEKLEKFIKKHKIGKEDAEILAKNIDIAEFYEKVAEKIDAKFALPWVSVELLRHLNYNKTSLDKIEIEVGHFVKLLELVKSGKITELQGKQMLNKFYPRSFDVTDQIKEKISDEKELEKIANGVINENKKAASDYKNGDEKAFNFLMGKIMQKTEKRADFAIAGKVLKRLLK
jgi:aspartyl-tRNA(Asn)/glutamyl-tRNA(Gln) amidotransferase subunit B